MVYNAWLSFNLVLLELPGFLVRGVGHSSTDWKKKALYLVWSTFIGSTLPALLSHRFLSKITGLVLEMPILRFRSSLVRYDAVEFQVAVDR
jgi:hypothetical protein